MFHLSTIRDIVRVLPEFFAKDRITAITDELNKKYANRVLHQVGLCLCVHDLLEIGEGHVHPCQDGSYAARVKFRMVVFRPHIGEILVGQILSTTDKGLKIGLKGWFEDIIVPAHLLQPGTRFDKASNCFIWDNEDVEPLAYDKGLKVRIRVQQERFVDVGPVKKTDKSKNSGGPTEVPYMINASMHEEGFGPLSWWDDEGDDDEEE